MKEKENEEEKNKEGGYKVIGREIKGGIRRREKREKGERGG